MAFDFGGFMSGLNPQLLAQLNQRYGSSPDMLRFQSNRFGRFGGQEQQNPNAPAMQNFAQGAMGTARQFMPNQPDASKFGGSVGTQNPGNVDINQVAGNVQGAFNRAGGDFQGVPGVYGQQKQKEFGSGGIGAIPQQPQPQAPVQKRQPGVDPYETWKAQGRPGGNFNAWMAQR